MPHRLIKTLCAEGHPVESVHSLGVGGVKNGNLYRLARHDFDLLFTKYVLVTLAQAPQEIFIKKFIAAFRKTDWSEHIHGNFWPE